MEIGHAVPGEEPRAGIHDRFRRTADRLAGRSGSLGVDARVGEVAGEYCPGRYSVNARGAVKIAGIGQRVVGGGSHTGVVLVVEGEDRINAVLEPVYAALGLDWAPDASGSVRTEAPSAGWDAVRDAIVTEYARDYDLVEDSVDAETLELAQGSGGGAPSGVGPAERVGRFMCLDGRRRRRPPSMPVVRRSGRRCRGLRRPLRVPRDRVHEGRPQLLREVVAHAGDRDQLGAGDRLRRRPPAAHGQREDRPRRGSPQPGTSSSLNAAVRLNRRPGGGQLSRGRRPGGGRGRTSRPPARAPAPRRRGTPGEPIILNTRAKYSM